MNPPISIAANPTGPIAVAIPCHNEAPALAELLARWRLALPEAEVVVFDNASTDGTASIAESAGVRVVPVPRLGKGHAVRAIFEVLGDRPAVVLTDGDGTYPPEEIGGLLGPILDGSAAMTVGARRPVGGGAMSPIRGLGNRLIRLAFWTLIGRPPGDLLSGYRVFGPTYLHAIRPRSAGFEIETELTGAAVGLGFRVVEVPVSYHPRAAGTASKLRAGRDGLRIVAMIASLSARLRPHRLILIIATLLATISGLIWAITS